MGIPLELLQQTTRVMCLNRRGINTYCEEGEESVRRGISIICNYGMHFPSWTAPLHPHISAPFFHSPPFGFV